MHSKWLLPRTCARNSGAPGQMTLSASNTVPFRSRPHSCRAQDKLEGRGSGVPSEPAPNKQDRCTWPGGGSRWGPEDGVSPPHQLLGSHGSLYSPHLLPGSDHCSKGPC